MATESSRRSLLTLADTEVLRAFFIERIDNFFRFGFRLEWGSGDFLLAFLQASTRCFTCRRYLLRRRCGGGRALHGCCRLLARTCCCRHVDD